MARVGGDVQLAGRWDSGGRAPSGWQWNGSQPCRGASDLLLPRPALGKMQGEPARRAGEPSGPGEEPPPERLGGHGPFARTGPRGPTGQVMRHHRYCEPGGVGGEAPRGHVVEPHAVLEVSNGVPGLGVAVAAGLQFPSSSEVSPSRPVMKP